nr:MAG TPA: hypothetical protein [Caudoviricetes sp.]
MVGDGSEQTKPPATGPAANEPAATVRSQREDATCTYG